MTQPLFILAPTRRSGTNFLANALRVTGICEFPSLEVLAKEDYLVAHIELLAAYADRAMQDWKRAERNSTILMSRRRQLLEELGQGIVRMIGASGDDAGRRVMLKTPSSRGLELLPDVFPQAQVLLLVRDGRDSTESAMRSGFAPNYTAAFSEWASGAQRILDFTRQRGLEWGESWKLVRFEDLVTQPAETLQTIASFLGADASSLDADKLRSLPVYGRLLRIRGPAGRRLYVEDMRPPSWVQPHGTLATLGRQHASVVQLCRRKTASRPRLL